MKLLILAVLFMACTGPRGPVGPQGEPGLVDTLPCHYYQQDGAIPPSDVAGYWLIRTDVSLFDSCVVTVLVKPVPDAFWREPRWEPYYDGDGIRIWENADCQQGYMYRVAVVWW